ncbi:phospho-sugar mutase [Eubacterium maltosivorans]|uniref:Phosphoglucomutase n=1 Tax=Eubacterium maltosivorans TaxID=2041044 RepID=A0A4P9C8Q9_EUBML|nr:phospho-sugar mutase [Eubacterium maltosivorans]ALU13272.1 phosphoglucomutase/phosphomannomutase family protein [Eubacterium limosum]QCT71814.1 phospho-sugar mutase [Eubacterium maltosivorans]
MGYKEVYQLWKDYPELNADLRAELEAMTDEGEIEDRFYQDLEFGTGGMRGKIGAGINRMNVYIVAKATYGLGKYLLATDPKNAEKGVAIAFDSRNKSAEFAQTAARVLAAMGVQAYLFESLRPTPVLSFTVRHVGAAGGIVITASHNPKEYNGYKVYGPDGGQMVSPAADELVAEIEKIDNYFDIPLANMQTAVEDGMIQIIGKEVDDAYAAAVENVVKANPGSDLKVIYTPIHGSGNVPVRRVLDDLGYKNVTVVAEQEQPDGNFPTVSYPNPEERSVFNIAMEMPEASDVDIIIGTDPDCDRVGVVGRNAEGEFVVFTGNQTGALLVDYFLKTRTGLPDNKVVIKTIVTSELGGIVAKANGAEVVDVLTGFKYIGEHMTEYEKTGEKTFAFGYEESYGYLAGNYARDKDAVLASALVCEMADYYKKQGMTLYDALEGLYQKFGYFIEGIQSMTLEGIEGKKQIANIMEKFRANHFDAFADEKLVTYNDYQSKESLDLASGEKSAIDLPKSNVLKFVFNENSWYALRPSGTEPKLKVYYSVTGKSRERAEEKMEILKKAVNEIIEA